MSKLELPVDKGWAWLVMIGCFTNYLMTISFIRALSIILPALLNKYKQSVAFVTLAFGIAEIMEAFATILTPYVFLPRFTVRTLCLCGGVIHSLGIVALAFTPNVVLLNVLFGCIGFARGVIINPQVYALGCYFKKRLSFASACANMGISVATLLSPLVTRFLLNTYNLEWTFLLLGAGNLHTIAASLLFRPLSMYENEAVDTKENGEDKACMDSAQEKPSDFCILSKTDSLASSKDSESNSQADTSATLFYDVMLKKSETHNMYTSPETLPSTEDSEIDSLMCTQKPPINKSQYDGKIAPNKDTQVESGGNSNPVRQWLRRTWSGSICSKPVAILLMIAGGLGVHTQAGNVYLPVLGLENGLTDNQLPWLLTITGATDIIGKLTIGLLADKNMVAPLYIACITQAIPGAALQLAPIYQGMGAMATLSVLYGLMAGILHILLPTLIIHMVGLPSLSRVFSGYYLLNCIVTFVMHLVVGALKDTTGSFVGGFRFVGYLFLASVLVLLLIIPVSKKGCCRQGSKSGGDNVTENDERIEAEDAVGVEVNNSGKNTIEI